LPGARSAHVAPIEALKEHRYGTSSDRPTSLSGGLIIAQVALSLVIVVAAALFGRTFRNLATVPLGFESDRVLLVNVSTSRTRVAAGERLQLFHRLALAAGAVPGVARAAASLATPVGGLGILDIVRLPGAPPSMEVTSDGKLADHSTFGNFITPGWFATYGTPIVAGRDFDERDVKGAPPVIIVNEAFIHRFLGGRNPLGATVELERGQAAALTKTIVGVVRNAAYGSLRDEAEPTEYAPLAQVDFPGPVPSDVTLSIRSPAGSPMLMARSVSAAFTALDPDLVFTFRPLTDQVSASVTQERVVAMLAGMFGGLALLLAGLGLYGVTSYAVSRRRTEIGIRMALGAAPGNVVQLVLARVATLVGLGVLAGAGVSMWASKFVGSLVYGLEPRDPATLVVATCMLVTVGALAGWLPAHRASRIEPAEVLRDT
jgi:predicted permease